MRIAFWLPCLLLSACSSDKPQQDELVTLDGGNGVAEGAASASAGGATEAPVTGVQAVNAEGPKLEPLLSSAISAAGLESGSCRFSPSQGALPVLVAGRSGGKAFVSVAGKEIVVAPAGTVAATGGSFSGDGVTLTVSASGKETAGSKATMQVNDADGPAFSYKDGFWACN